MSPEVGYFCGKILSFLKNDVVITREEIAGLTANLLSTPAAPTAPTRFSDWLKENAGTLGRHYLSELARRR